MNEFIAKTMNLTEMQKSGMVTYKRVLVAIFHKIRCNESLKTESLVRGPTVERTIDFHLGAGECFNVKRY